MEYVWLFVVTGAIFAGIDAIWLKLTAAFYKKEFGSLLRPVPNFTAAIIFYFLYILGIVIFVLEPALGAGQWWHAIVYGGLFGMITYATYDLTNLATLKRWSVKVTIIDILWGGVATGASSLLAYSILKGWVF